MQFEVLISPHALDDIEEAFQYYNDKVERLGARFVGQVQSTIRKIEDNPFVYAIRYGNIRCAGVWKFPFLVHFQINEDSRIIIVLAVYSTYKRPKWEAQI